MNRHLSTGPALPPAGREERDAVAVPHGIVRRTSAGARGAHGVASYRLLGVQVDAFTTESLYACIRDSVEAKRRCVIGNHNLHSIHLYHRDPKMQRFYSHADHTFIDSMPLTYLGRLLGLPLRRENRTASLDWLRPLLPTARDEGWRVFLLGSPPGVAEQAADILRSDCPGLQLEVHHGYFDATPGSDESNALLAHIRDFRPDLLIVGMGMPRQEHWIADELGRIEATVILPLGAIIDQIAGTMVAAPRWTGQLGVEWLVRLLSEPKRMWRRYLLEPWSLLPIFLSELLRSNRPEAQLRELGPGPADERDGHA